MNQDEGRSTVEQILSQDMTGPMSTIQHQEPVSRYMTFLNKELSLYTATSKDTDKVDELRENPYTHILLGYEGDGYGDAYVEYQGKVSMTDDEQIKKELWVDEMKAYFDGPEDPNLAILKITPEHIQLMNKMDGSAEITLDL